MGQAALGSLRRKLSGGPGAYEGLWELLARTYHALGSGAEPPITSRQMIEVNRLVEDLKAGATVVVPDPRPGAGKAGRSDLLLRY